MLTARHLSILSMVAASLALGSPSLAGWSPLQNEMKQEVKMPKGSMFEVTYEDPNEESTETENTRDVAPPAKRLAPDGEASEALSDDELKKGDVLTPEDEQKEAVEIKKKPRAPGKHPTEAIEDPEYFCSRAQEFLHNGDYQSALNYINKSVELNPQYWNGWYQKALIYQNTGYEAAAARRYIWLLERKPEMVEARVALGMLYRKHKNYTLAEKEYKKAIEANYYCFPAHYNLANVLMEQDRMEVALKEYKVCLKLKPNNALVHNNMGVIYQKRNYLEDAVQEFKLAQKLDPKNKIYADNLTAVREKLSAKAKKDVAM